MNASAIKEVLRIPYFRLFGYRPQQVSAETWDRQYRAGSWDYLDRIDNLGGQLTVFGYCQYLAPGSILDVGCGAGLLAKKLKVLPYRRFLGIDLSAEAITEAREAHGDARTTFIVADAEKFAPESSFDVIVFNQCLYYLSDPLDVIRRYGRFLDGSGRMIVSLYDCSRSRAVWSLIDDHVDVEDSMTVIQAGGRTTTKILRPR